MVVVVFSVVLRLENGCSVSLLVDGHVDVDLYWHWDCDRDGVLVLDVVPANHRPKAPAFMIGRVL